MIAPLSANSSTLKQPPPPQKTRLDGDSDSDWDDDDDFVAKKINIKIKPITQMTPSEASASIDELKATVGTWKSMGNVNLVKPNSRRSQHLVVQPSTPPAFLQQQQPMPQLQAALTQLPITPQTSNIFLLPVAIAVQECLNVRTLLHHGDESLTSLMGHVRMAVPTKIIEMDEAQFENNNLVFDISTSKQWSDVRLNDEFVKETSSIELSPNANTNGSFYLDPINAPVTINSSSTSLAKSNIQKITVDMKMVYKYSKNMYKKRPSGSYILLPELLNYKIERSHNQLSGEEDQVVPNGNGHLMNRHQSDLCLNPIKPVAHWLCDLSVTKVRIDLEYLEEELVACGLQASDVKDVKISLQVDGGVESHQSKPQAVWSPIDSKLTWSFDNLSELIRVSTHNGVTSCLAKLNLNDGPSTPDDMDIQFSISGKTLSGTRLMINPGRNQKSGKLYRISKQKFEVKTGRFRCESPGSSASSLI